MSLSHRERLLSTALICADKQLIEKESYKVYLKKTIYGDSLYDC